MPCPLASQTSRASSTKLIDKTASKDQSSDVMRRRIPSHGGHSYIATSLNGDLGSRFIQLLLVFHLPCKFLLRPGFALIILYPTSTATRYRISYPSNPISTQSSSGWETEELGGNRYEESNPLVIADELLCPFLMCLSQSASFSCR